MTTPGRAALLLAWILALLGCDDGPRVVLYASADDALARAVVARFEQAHGVTVDLVGDAEAVKTTGLVERLRAERDRPVADVFWSSEHLQTIRLAEEDVLEPHAGPRADAWPARWRDPQGRWFGFAARARVLVCAADRVSEDDRPVAWTDLVRDAWRDRIVMADPRFGTTGTHLGAMLAWWDARVAPGYYEAFMMGLRDNGVRLLPSGNAGVVQAVVDGEADLGLTDTDDAWAALDAGANLAVLFLDHNRDGERGDGSLLIPNTVSRVRGGPNPDNAALLVEFLLSPETERFIASTPSRNIPLGTDPPEALAPFVPPRALAIDDARAAARRREAVDVAMRFLGAGAR